MSIIIPASVEVLDENCVYSCSNLESVTFKVGSHLQRIEGGAFLATCTYMVFLRGAKLSGA
jgi:hypothetical protein